MKLFVILVIASLVCGAWSRATGQNCEQKFGFESGEEDMSGDVTQRLKCFALCKSEESGIMENGRFSEKAQIIKQFPDSLIDASMGYTEAKQFRAVKSCLNIYESDPCELAFKFTLCVAEKAT